MSVPSVATSISPRQSSTSIFFPSPSNLAESIMVTPTEDLVSQQILSLPPQSSIVDMATLNSLDMHSCQDIKLSCRNVEPLPSHESSSLTVDPLPHASNLITSKVNKYGENIMENQEKLKSLPLAELCPKISDCNFLSDVGVQQTSNSSCSSTVKASEHRFLNKFGKENEIQGTFAYYGTLPKCLKMSNEVDFKTNGKAEVELDVSKNSNITQEIDENSVVESPSLHTNIFHDNTFESFPSMKSSKEFHSDVEGNCNQEISTAPFQMNVTNEFYFSKAVSSSNERCKKPLQVNPRFNGEITSSFASNEPTLQYQNSVYFSRCNSTETSYTTERQVSLHAANHSSDATFLNATSASESLERPVTCSRNSDGAMSILAPLIDSGRNQELTLKSSLIMSPSLCYIDSDTITEIIAPELKSYYDFEVPYSKKKIINGSYLCNKIGQKKDEEPLTLILAEIPEVSEQIIAFDLLKILPECSSKNLVFEKKAAFDMKSSVSNKKGLLNLIKVTAVENHTLKANSRSDSSVSSKILTNDQLFIKINSASDSLTKLTFWGKILPANEIASSVEDNSNGCISCTIIRLDKQFPIKDEDFLRGDKSDSKPTYLGLLVPSSNFLHSLNISTYPKDSLSISLSSSRPNQQYSTCTSVDVQFNGNNEDSVPVIPLGIYSPKGNADVDSKWLTSFTDNSLRDVQKLEDIFLIPRDIKEERINPDFSSLKQLDLTDILLNKSLNCNYISENEFLCKESKRENFYDNVFSPEIHFQGKEFQKSKSAIPLKYFLETGENICRRMQKSNEVFHSKNIVDNYQPAMEETNIENKMQHKDLIDSKYTSRLVSKNKQTVVLEKEVPRISNNTSVGHSGRKSNTTSESVNHVKFGEIKPSWKCDAIKQDCHHVNDSKDMTEKSVKGIFCGLKTNHVAMVRDNLSILRFKNDFKNNKSCNDLQKRTNQDQVGLDILDTNFYSLKKKIQAKRLEGYCRPFKISKTGKNKPAIEIKKIRKNSDDEYVKVKEDLDSKLSSTLKPVSNSWSLNHCGYSCLMSIKKLLAMAVLESDKSSSNCDLHIMEESNERDGKNYKSSSGFGILSTPQTNIYDKFSSRERARQPSNFKSSDRKLSRNFLLSSSSTKRSKLTILIFCLAVTSLLISLHALSTDSSLYIKPTFFLVQEDGTSSFNSENSFLSKSSLHYSEKMKWRGAAVTNEPILRGISVNEEIGLVKGEDEMGNSVSYVKSRKDMSKWTFGGNIDSRNDVIIKDRTENHNRITKVSDKIVKSEQMLSMSKSSFISSNEGNLKSNISKSTSKVFEKVNFSVPKNNASSSVNRNNNDGSSFLPRDENSLGNKYEDENENTEKNLVHLTTNKFQNTYSETVDDLPGPEENADESFQLNNRKTLDISHLENQTKPSLSNNNEGTASSPNEFDLNLAFIEKNELNAAYGIDSGTTGADGNIEDYVGEEDTTVLATSGNRLKFPKATRRLPQALIIGVRKGGTRALLEMLHLHPLIQKAAGEAHFFDRDENYAKGLQWYRRRMPPSLKGQITVEKSPSYFVTPEVPERVRAMNASIRLLLIVREPVTRAISDFAQLRSHTAATKTNATSRTKIDGGMDEDYGKKQLTRPLSSFESLAILPDGRVDMSWRPISVSLYHRHISAWLEAFPRDQILIVDGDQLASNPAPVLASVEKFLKLRPALTPTHFYFNATKGFYCLRSLPPGQQVDGMAMLPSSINHSSSLPEGKCLRESKGRRHPHVDPSVVHKLRRFFAEHNRRFYEMVGEDFGWPEE